MAEIVKAAGASICSTDAAPSEFPRYTAGEDIPAVSQIALKSDGLAYKATAADFVIGVNPVAASSGEAVTAARGQRFYYGTVTPGVRLYPSGTIAGGLADAATSGNLPCALGLPDGRIQSLT